MPISSPTASNGCKKEGMGGQRGLVDEERVEREHTTTKITSDDECSKGWMLWTDRSTYVLGEYWAV